ncbi:hypothetical protein EYR40_004908 [Pleurotus pulmonarius]|nr:hypothetical protein EYR40_004908 [Pleurotus pulmonarius]
MSTFTAAHRSYVMSLYKRTLKNSLDWTVRRDLWRAEAMMIRAEFERNRDVHDPRALAVILEKAEANLAKKKHPDPVISPLYPGGTKCRSGSATHPFVFYTHFLLNTTHVSIATACNGSTLRPPFRTSALSDHIPYSRENVWSKIEIGRQAVISSSLLHVSLPTLIFLPFTSGSGPILVIDSFRLEGSGARTFNLS